MSTLSGIYVALTMAAVKSEVGFCSVGDRTVVKDQVNEGANES